MLGGRTITTTQGVPPHQRFKNNFYRVTGSFGVNAGLINDAPSAFAMFGSYQVGHSTLTGGFLSSNNTNRIRKTWIEGDVLYGYAWNGYDFGYFSKGATDFWVTASAGLGLVTYDVRPRRFSRFGPPPPIDSTLPQNTYQYGIGLPVQLQASYAISRFLGVSATLFANFNKIQITYGAMAGVQVGWF